MSDDYEAIMNRMSRIGGDGQGPWDNGPEEMLVVAPDGGKSTASRLVAINVSGQSISSEEIRELVAIIANGWVAESGKPIRPMNKAEKLAHLTDNELMNGPWPAETDQGDICREMKAREYFSPQEKTEGTSDV